MYNIQSQSEELSTHISQFGCYLGPSRRLLEPEIELAIRNKNTDWFIVIFDISELFRPNTRMADRSRTFRWTEIITFSGDGRIGTTFGSVC